MVAIKIRKALGNRAFWNRVGYHGRAFAPALKTYPGVDVLSFGARNDSGQTADIYNLLPLIAAALYEAGFANGVRSAQHLEQLT